MILSVEFLTMMFITIYVSQSGDLASTGLQLAISYNYFLSLMISGFSEAASLLIANDIKNPLKATKNALMVYAINTGTSAVTASAAWLFAPNLVKLFLDSTHQHQDISKLIYFLHLQALIEIPNAIRNTGLNIIPVCEPAIKIENKIHLSHAGTKYLFYLTALTLFALNSTLATLAHFRFQYSAEKTYSTQLIGYFLVAIGSLIINQIELIKLQKIADQLRLMPIETPRHPEVTYSLNTPIANEPANIGRPVSMISDQ